MARARKRLTRKDLRQPDQFMTLTSRVLSAVEENRNLFLSALAILLLLSLGLWGWQVYKGRHDRLAARHFAEGVELYHAGNYHPALAAFEKLEEYRWSRYYPVGLLYQANSNLALNNWDKAIEAARRFTGTRPSEPFLRQLALATLGYAHERRSDCAEALKPYAEAEKLGGAFSEQALMGMGRCSAEIGDLKAAIEIYRRYLAEFPGSSAVTQISLRLQELESTIGEKNRAQ